MSTITRELTMRDIKRMGQAKERHQRVGAINEMRNKMRTEALTVNQESFFMTTLMNLTVFSVVYTAFLWLVNTILIGVVGATDNAFYGYIDSGAFKDQGYESAWSMQLMGWVSKFMGVALPTMSILSITFVMLSLICTVLYLFKQEYFDQVHLAKRAVRESKGGGNGGSMGNGMTAAGNALRNLTSNNAVSQYGLFKCYICPNVKGIAFAEATDQPMSVADFFKVNFFKIIIMFAFCMAISDQTMLNLFLRGAEIGKYGFDKLSQVQYATIIDGFLNTGTDYKPAFNTRDTTGKNKTKMFNAIYSQLKTRLDTDTQRSTSYKQAMGQHVVEWIEGEGQTTSIPWGNRTFSVKAEIYQYAPTMAETENVRYVSMPTFGFSELANETLCITFFSQDNEDFTSVLETTYPTYWTPGEHEVKWDMSGIKPATASSDWTLSINSFGSITVSSVDDNGKMVSTVFTQSNLDNGTATKGDVSVELVIGNGTGYGDKPAVIGYTIKDATNKINSIAITGVTYRTKDAGGNGNALAAQLAQWSDMMTHNRSTFLASASSTGKASQ